MKPFADDHDKATCSIPNGYLGCGIIQGDNVLVVVKDRASEYEDAPQKPHKAGKHVFGDLQPRGFFAGSFLPTGILSAGCL